MDADFVAKVEGGLDAGAAALFAAAVAYALSQAAPESAVVTACIAALAFGLCFALLRRVAPEEPGFTMPEFAIAKVPVYDTLPDDSDELLLDDMLPEPDPDSRVVRLFDRSAMPARVLAGQAIPSAPADASEALHQALEELRRSLVSR